MNSSTTTFVLALIEVLGRILSDLVKYFLVYKFGKYALSLGMNISAGYQDDVRSVKVSATQTIKQRLPRRREAKPKEIAKSQERKIEIPDDH